MFDGMPKSSRLRTPKPGGIAAAAHDGKVTPAMLAARGLIRQDAKIKILSNGEVTGKLEVHAHAVSGPAREKIEKAGGSIVLIA